MEESLKTILENFRTAFRIEGHEIGEYSGLQLAYIGDAAYEMVIRTYVMDQGNMQVEKMHKHTTSLVRAGAQAAMYRAMNEADILTDEETRAYKLGRNSKSYTKAKNATMTDYRTATGFEALMGWLYMTGHYSRMIELIAFGLKAIGELKENE
ncbi:ribonuclease III domain-containing protein [[Clostridium] aminophilum]|uniref:Mini-ribonuclease 3 n=1 Tax=[Clostridium] aminophilum TaxID=1526 RepID=UPI003331D376